MLKEESKVLKRKRGRRNTPLAIKVHAVERMKLGADVTALARELGVDRSLLYYWKKRLTGGPLRPSGEAAVVLDAQEVEIRQLRAQLAQTQAALGQKAAELDFFAGALRQIEPTAPSRSGSSANVSTSTPQAVRDRKANLR